MKKITRMNAIVWAILLLVITYIFREHEYAKFTGMIFILGYTTSEMLFRKAIERKNEKC